MELPPLPRHTVVVVEELPTRDPPGFLGLRRVAIRIRFEDGEESEPLVYDTVARDRLDAVIVVPHYRDARGLRHVYLRSALRPPIALRPRDQWPMPERDTLGTLWEVPAGIVEADERSPAGLVGCAVRELLEEVGAAVDAGAVHPLGPSMFPAPGMIGERHFYFHVEVDPTTLTTPTEDGSALERGAAVVAIPLAEALDLCRRGVIEDVKTELALRRLAEIAP